MRYYKKVMDGKVVLVGKGPGGEEITQTEYNALLEKIRNTPFELPEGVDDEITAEEALEIILGGDVP